MDYASKAKELRERIFNHAEEGHGGPCLRAGPLEQMLEEWLRLNCAPQASSYPYGHRVAMTEMEERERARIFNNSPPVGSATIAEVVKSILDGRPPKLPAGFKITDAFVDGLQKALTDAQLYGTGVVKTDGAHTHAIHPDEFRREMTATELREFRDQYLSDPAAFIPKRGARMTMGTMTRVYAGIQLGWLPEGDPRLPRTDRERHAAGWMTPEEARKFSDEHLISDPFEYDPARLTRQEQTRMTIVERMKRERGFKI
jgi:hypothetical protein